MIVYHTVDQLPKVNKFLLYRKPYSNYIVFHADGYGNFIITRDTLIQYLKNVKYIGVERCLDMLWNTPLVEVDVYNLRHMNAYGLYDLKELEIY